MKYILFLLVVTNNLYAQKQNYSYWEMNRMYWMKDSTFETGFRYSTYTLLKKGFSDFKNYTKEDIFYLFGKVPVNETTKEYVIGYPVSANLEDCNLLINAIKDKNQCAIEKFKYKNCLGSRYFLVFYVNKETNLVVDLSFIHEDW